MSWVNLRLAILQHRGRSQDPLWGEHNYRLVSTYPFDNLLIRFKELGPTVKTKGDVVIGNDVWIGYGAMILSGVSIGDGRLLALDPSSQ